MIAALHAVYTRDLLEGQKKKHEGYAGAAAARARWWKSHHGRTRPLSRVTRAQQQLPASRKLPPADASKRNILRTPRAPYTLRRWLQGIELPEIFLSSLQSRLCLLFATSSMSHTDTDGARLQAMAQELLNDPVEKANHIITLLKAVHASKPAVGVRRDQQAVCWLMLEPPEWISR